MGKYFNLGRRGGKSNLNAEGLSNYLKSFTKKEKEQIKRELEKEEDSEQESFSPGYTVTFPSEYQVNPVHVDGHVFNSRTFDVWDDPYYNIVVQPATINDQLVENYKKDAEVVDVDFEE